MFDISPCDIFAISVMYDKYLTYNHISDNILQKIWMTLLVMSRLTKWTSDNRTWLLQVFTD